MAASRRSLSKNCQCVCRGEGGDTRGNSHLAERQCSLSRSLARSLLDLQIKATKTDRSVGINIRKCFHFTARLSKADFFSAFCLLFMPERLGIQIWTERRTFLVHKHNTEPQTSGSTSALPPSYGGKEINYLSYCWCFWQSCIISTLECVVLTTSLIDQYRIINKYSLMRQRIQLQSIIQTLVFASARLPWWEACVYLP